MKLGEIAKESRETYKGDKQGIPLVGLEHLISGEIRFNGYDINIENTFTKRFHKGQILFGRRRAYLKKAAIAEFDGICSGDITVIEAIKGKVEPDLLPFIIQNDALFDFAVSRSAGGLSPRVRWEHLADYEFDLPAIEKQRVLADKLWAAYNLKEAYKRMISATDEMVKSQFIEMFKNIDQTSSLNNVCLKITDGSHNPPKGIKLSDYIMISSKNVFYDGLIIDDVRYVSKDDFEKEDRRTSLIKNDILVTIVGTIGRLYIMKGDEGKIVMQRSVAVLRPNTNLLIPEFLAFSLKVKEQELQNRSHGNAQKGLYLTELSKIEVKLPPINLQNSFANISKQADKSKFELKKAIENIDKVIKSLLQ